MTSRHPNAPDEPCVNPACETSVYWPDERSFWATVWIPERGRDNTITRRACSLRCLALVLGAATAGNEGQVDTRWGT